MTIIKHLQNSKTINMIFDKNSFVCSINGSKCITKKEALAEIGRAFNFPEYYGENLDALYDCLTDLSWLRYSKVFFIVNNQEDFLKSETPEIRTDFLDLLNDVKDEWKNNDESDKKDFTLLYTSAN